MSSTSRSGVALVIATVAMVLLMTLAMSLTSMTISSNKLGQQRIASFNLTVSAESVANLSFNYLQNASDLLTQLANARLPGATPVDITSASLALAATYNGKKTLNGVDSVSTQVISTWKYLGAMTIPINGTSGSRNLYQITAVSAVAGPAVYLNADGTKNAVQDQERFRRRQVEAVFTEFPSDSYRQAMFAMNGYQFMGSATTDSWDSNSGAASYAASPHGSKGDLSSNGTITVQQPGNVNGTVRSQINMPMPALTYNPPAGAIALPGPLGTFTTTSGAACGNPMVTGVYRCSKIDEATNNGIAIAAGAVIDIYLDGPLIITKDWEIPATATVRIFQNDYNPSLGVTKLNGNIVVGCPTNPRSLQIYSMYTGTLDGTDGSSNGFDIQMNGTASLGAVIMAPSATFDLNGTFDYYGSMVCGSYKDNTGTGKVNGNFAFHYDESLTNLAWPFPPTLVVVGWRASDLGLSQ
ncbi:MAG: hypothetical protein AAB263_01715 [Planctomycetota bacterium]